MIALLASPLARWGTVAAFCGALALWGWSERIGRQAATERALEAETIAAGRARAIAALESEAEAARARAARFANIRDRINAAAPSQACASSEPIRAALDGLRATAPARAGAAVTSSLRDRAERP